MSEAHPVSLEVDGLHLGLVEDDAATQLLVPRSHDLLGTGEPEGDEEEPRPVGVDVILVDHVDLRHSSSPRRRRSRLATIVPPVLPPRTTIFGVPMLCPPMSSCRYLA